MVKKMVFPFFLYPRHISLDWYILVVTLINGVFTKKWKFNMNPSG